MTEHTHISEVDRLRSALLQERLRNALLRIDLHNLEMETRYRLCLGDQVDAETGAIRRAPAVQNQSP